MTEPSWWEWLTAKPDELRKRGIDPSERYSRIGHKRALSRNWARTVGYWGVAPAAVIIERAGVSRTSYDQFKFRWGTRSGSATGFLGEPLELAYLIYADVETVADAKDRRPTIDDFVAVAHYSTGLDELPDDDERKLVNGWGILPVEALLYHAAIEQILYATGLDSLAFGHLMEENSRRSDDYKNPDLAEAKRLWRNEKWAIVGSIALPKEVDEEYATSCGIIEDEEARLR